MKYSMLTQRLINDVEPGESPVDPWAVHDLAMQRRAQGEDITLLSIGQESNETSPAVVVEAAIESLRSGRHHYVELRGEQHLRQAIADYHDTLTGQRVSADQVTVATGAQNALFSVAQLLLEPGDELILVAPYYTTYEATFGASGASIVKVRVSADDAYQLDMQQVLDAITPATQLIVLNSPNNPLGSSYRQDQLMQLAERCLAEDIWLVLDTVYLDTVSPGSVALPHAIPGIERILITIGSLSKSHRMTGWRIGWAIGPTELSVHLARLATCLHYGMPPFIQDAATVAIREAASTPQTVRAVMQKRRELLLSHLQELAPVRLLDAGQGMFILLDVEPLGLSAHDFAMALLNRENVSVLPCDGFGPGGRHLVRIGLCVDGDQLGTAGRKISRFVQSLAREAGIAPT